MTADEQQKIEFGKRLRELRKRRGLSAEQLGDKIGVARTTVFGYEQGQRIPDMITIKKIAELFFEYLFCIIKVSRQGGFCSLPKNWFSIRDHSSSSDADLCRSFPSQSKSSSTSR